MKVNTKGILDGWSTLAVCLRCFLSAGVHVKSRTKAQVWRLSKEETERVDKAGEDWVDGLIRHDWSSGQVPPSIMKFGAPIVSGLWDQTHSFVRNLALMSCTV